MKPGDLVIMTLSRNSLKRGTIGLIVEQLIEANFDNSHWFTCIFDGKLHTVHESTLRVVDG